jgi:hypothetical protein
MLLHRLSGTFPTLTTAGCCPSAADAGKECTKPRGQVARLRLHLAQAYPEARWESDRAIRARWHGSGARVRLADGGLYFPTGDAMGVECELHVKRLDRYQAVVADVDPAWSSGVWWFTPRAQVGLLQQRLQDAGAGAHHEVVTAPEGVAS